MIRIDVSRKLGAFALDVAFSNDAGITALFGRSGSGKSMTMNLIAGLGRPDRGYIVLDNRVLVDTQDGVFVPRHRRRVGLVVFQDAQLFPHFNVRQNLLFGRWFAPKDERGVASNAGLVASFARHEATSSGAIRAARTDQSE